MFVFKRHSNGVDLYENKAHLLFGALGLALAVGPPAAGAGTVIAPGFGKPVGAVIVPQQPPIPTATVVQWAATIQTTETVRSAGHVPAHRQVVTTRTITRRVVPTPAAIAGTAPAVLQPLYDAAVPVVVPRPLYDVAVPATVPQALRCGDAGKLGRLLFRSAL